jgi:cytochrome c oxidase cbb3-type subunit 3
MKQKSIFGMVSLAVLAVLSLASATGLHAGPAPAGSAPAGKEMKNPFAGMTDAIKEGDKLFDEKCSECHMDGTGGAGPNLTDDTWIYGGSDTEVFETIAYGRKGGMPSWKSELGADKIWKIIAYIRSIYRK